MAKTTCCRNLARELCPPATAKRYHMLQLKKKKRTHELQLRPRTSKKKKKKVFTYICIYVFYLNITFLIKIGNTLRNRSQNKLAKDKSTLKTNSERETRKRHGSSVEAQGLPSHSAETEQAMQGKTTST